nr:uncharacterized protein LOC109398597 [Aedes albopictus]
MTMEFLVLNKVTAKQPVESISTHSWTIPENVSLADPKFNVRGEVDLILGVQHFFSLFGQTPPIHLGPNLPLVVETVFGWVIAGSASLQPHSRITISNYQIGTQSSIKFDPDETVKTLGITWEPESDCLKFDISIKENDGPLTKRKIQSCIAQLYDPLGLISPVVISAKIIMQRLWLIPIGWDDEVPKDLQELWQEFRPQINELAACKVDRFIFLPNAVSVQLHCFADASKVAYGCCIYARSVDEHGTVKVQLVSAKSRVAPLKRLSIPRLELCAAQLAARLYTKVTQALELEFDAVHFWSDSTVVLDWLRAPSYHWKTFVANRVSEIQTTTHNAPWKHVPGTQNPADLVSRGMHVSDFLESSLWHHGPEWLGTSEENWPQQKELEPAPEDQMERETVAAVAACTVKINPIFSRYSHFTKLIRVTAWISRFRRNCQSRHLGQHPHLDTTLSVEELESAKHQLVRLVQSETYQQEIKDLSTGKLVSPKSTIRNLLPFCDEKGILRLKRIH